MTALRIILGDQVTHGIAALRDADPGDVVLLAEVRAECTYVRHHKQKIALVLSAMRHFAAELAARGVQVAYTRLDNPANTHTLRGEVCRAAAAHGATRLIATHPGEQRVLDDMKGWGHATGLPLDIRDDDRFIADLDSFRAWAEGRKQLRMEYFYRDMRRRTGLLMEGPDAPAGGEWNYDSENRARLPAGTRVPKPRRFPPDAITQDVMALVAREFPGHFGTLDAFAWPVTAAEAAAALADFIAHRLPRFGDYQDAMAEGEPTLFHALIGTSLNLGLLDPLAACRAAEAAWRQGAAPLNAVEGFIRQILGWREYVRGLYWLKMPAYRETNALAATRRLPDFYWTGATSMACMEAAIRQTRDLAYAHHIQRLMVTGNFALIAGLDVKQVQDWYLAVYSDAYEWVEMPNTLGMALFGDGGLLGSKPYAASGKYIDKMSNYCAGCRYDPQQMLGETACPFNALYWDFFARNRDKLEANQRLPFVYSTWDKFSPERQNGIKTQAASVLDRMAEGTL